MKTVRLRIIRVLGAIVVGSVLFLLFVKTSDNSLQHHAAGPDYRANVGKSPGKVGDDPAQNLRLDISKGGRVKIPSHNLGLGDNRIVDELPRKPQKVDDKEPRRSPFLDRIRPPAPPPNDKMNPGNSEDNTQFGSAGRAGHVGQQNAVSGAVRDKHYPMMKDGKFIPMRRIVHFDLKGAAPRVEYFEPVFKLIKKLGGTGVLLEWEDVFPFEGVLDSVRAGNAYSKADVTKILNAAKKHGLDIIPLVQTFGHLEYILKLEKFKELRESPRFPQVMCPSNDKAVDIVLQSIDQVIALHPDITYFHIGADEAFQIGMCAKCQDEIGKLNGYREALIARHIEKIARYVKEKYNKKVMIWHDMVNNIEPELLTKYHLGELVEPVVWMYAENLDDYLWPEMWQRFATVFPNIWGASAYKGADGPMRYHSNIPHYLANHVSWIDQMTRNYKEFKGEFAGLIFTGWQRYDHFAILCELLPVGIPSLAVNLLTIQRGGHSRRVMSMASEILGCAGTLEDMGSPGMSEGFMPQVPPTCGFPGAPIYQLVQQLRVLQDSIQKQVKEDHQVNGWLARFNQVNNYSQAWYLDQIQDKISYLYEDLKSLRQQLETALLAVFAKDTADEFLMEHLDSDLDYLGNLLSQAQRLGNMQTFPKRPFPINNPSLKEMERVKKEKLAKQPPY